MRSPAMLQITNLSKSFGNLMVLNSINLDIRTGERVALMGRSGSGKSTLLNCISGIESFDCGEVFFCGKTINYMNLSELEELRRESLGYVFQSFHLLPTLTALENVEFSAQLVNSPRVTRRKRARELLRFVGLEHRETHRPDALSGGERQRVALARAVINHPRLILADEPTGNLDSFSGELVLNLIERISNEEGIAVLLVTHDQNTSRICNRIVEMKDGQILGHKQ